MTSREKEAAARIEWEKANGRKAGKDDWYDPAMERWVHFADEHDLAERRAGLGMAANIVLPDCSFVSTSLPKDYEIHRQRGGRFVHNPGGDDHRACIIENRADMHDLIREGNDRGERIAYAGPGREFYPD